MMEMVIQFIMSMLGVMGLSVLFNVPRRQFLWCAVTGGVGWIVYLLVQRGTGSTAIAAFVATLALTVLSRALSTARETPTTVFLIPGIFPIVPGAGIYYTAYYFFTNDYAMAADMGIEALKIAGAIALGILFGFAVPGALFAKLFGPRRSGGA